jgi:hypothetical protein
MGKYKVDCSGSVVINGEVLQGGSIVEIEDGEAKKHGVLVAVKEIKAKTEGK